VRQPDSGALDHGGVVAEIAGDAGPRGHRMPMRTLATVLDCAPTSGYQPMSGGFRVASAAVTDLTTTELVAATDSARIAKRKGVIQVGRLSQVR